MDNPIPQPAAVPPHDPAPLLALPADFGPAGFWIRAGAYMIDALLVTTGQALVNVVLVLAGMPNALSNIISSVVGIGYFVWLPVARHGQTVGKMAAGIAIVRMEGAPLTYLRCLGRWAAYLLSGIVAGLGFVVAAFTDKKRALHDYIADTRVVYVAEVGGGRKAAVVLLGILVPLVFMAGLVAALAIPKFRQAAQRVQEGSAINQLGTLRAAAAMSYGASQGQYPAQLSDLAPKHIPALPALRLKEHPESAAAAAYDASVCGTAGLDLAKVKDTGQWGYVYAPGTACHGTVFIDCTHTDLTQKQWASY